MCALEPIASTELLRRAIEDVGFVHDRFVESMWAEQSSARLEAFEKELARATETLAIDGRSTAKMQKFARADGRALRELYDKTS